MLAVAYGVVADVSVPAERGRMLGTVMVASNLGPCVGPFIGGIVVWSSGSFQWAFWTLVMFGSTALCLIGFGLAETARRVVGNGEHVAEKWSRKTWWCLLTGFGRSRADEEIKERKDLNEAREEVLEKRTQDQADKSHEKGHESRSPWLVALRQSNALSCLQIICHRDTSLVLWMSVSFYTVWYTIQASIPSIYTSYGFNELLIGLAFLPGGLGVILGGWVTGRVMDVNYRRTAKEAGLPVDRHAGDDLEGFPIEKARARGSAWQLVLFAGVLLSFGWTVDRGTHPAVPLVLQFALAFVCTYFFQTFNSLLVDIFPENPSTAAAAGNISRCVLSGAAVALLQPIVDALGRGWFFTILCAFLTTGNVVALTMILSNGRKWRETRITKKREKQSQERIDLQNAES